MKINSEISNSAQTILGYVVMDRSRYRMFKSSDINNIGLMEDRATLRIHLNTSLIGFTTELLQEIQVTEIMKAMAKVVDKQNEGDKNYKDE